jgi:DNA end-binding protein Ku
MPRAIWKGAISFALVTIPVGLYSAVARSRELSFRLLHAKDASPIDYRRFCEAEDVEVSWDDIVRGYEYEKGRYVVLTEKDFQRARVPASDTFEIRDFVPAQAIDAVYFDHPYHVAPSGRAAAKAYALLRDALERSQRVGVGTIVLRQREHLAALAPAGGSLALTTMRFAYELRSPETLHLPRAGAGYDKREMDLALRLVETLSGDWKPEKYKDTYRDVLMEAIEQKVAGKEISIPAPQRPPKVVDLMEALRASLDSRQRRPPARTAGRRSTSHRRAARTRRRAA